MPRFRVDFLCNKMPSLTALCHVEYYILILFKRHKLTSCGKLLTFAWCYTKFLFRAGVTQLVEYKLPKLGVAGSNPVARSILYFFWLDSLPLLLIKYLTDVRTNLLLCDSPTS